MWLLFTWSLIIEIDKRCHEQNQLTYLIQINSLFVYMREQKQFKISLFILIHKCRFKIMQCFAKFQILNKFSKSVLKETINVLLRVYFDKSDGKKKEIQTLFSCVFVKIIYCLVFKEGKMKRKTKCYHAKKRINFCIVCSILKKNETLHFYSFLMMTNRLRQEKT